jgi:hypothetical protein
MKIFTNAMIIILLSLSIATAAAAMPASEKSIKQLMDVTQAHKIIDNVMAQLDKQISNLIQQELKGKNPTEKQQKAISDMMDRIVALMKKEMAWEKLEPMYIRLYSESFTEEEIVGMLKFYKTPAGKAVIKKMPVLTQKIMEESQKITIVAMPQIKKIVDDFEKEIKESGN